MSSSTVDARRHRTPLVVLLAASVVSTLGNVMAMIAIPWFVLATTGSPARTGIAWAMTALPMAVAGVFGGTIVDRLGFKRMSVAADLASSVPIIMIPLLYLTVGLEFWQLLALIFLGAFLDVPGMTARTSLLPDLAAAARMGLERANAIEQSIGRLSLMLGAPAAGLLIAVVGVTNVLWITAAGFLLSAALTAVFVPASMTPRPSTQEAESYLTGLRAGFAYVRTDRLILTFVTVLALANFLQAMLTVIYPVFAERAYGSSLSLGLIFAGSGAGSLLSLLLFGLFGHAVPRRDVFIWSFVLAGLPLLAFVATPALAIIIVASLFRGAGAALINPVVTTIMQERVPVALRGRVFGLASASAWVMMPIGALLSGFSIELIGLVATIAVVGVVHIAISLGTLLLPGLHEMNRAPLSGAVREAAPINRRLAMRGKGRT